MSYAIKSVATAPIGTHAIFADLINKQAAAISVAFGFTPLVRQPRTFSLSLATALRLLSP